MKNCSPPAKNLAPSTVMVGMARTARAKHAANAAPISEVNMLQLMLGEARILNWGLSEVAMGSEKTQLLAEMQSKGTNAKSQD